MQTTQTDATSTTDNIPALTVSTQTSSIDIAAPLPVQLHRAPPPEPQAGAVAPTAISTRVPFRLSEEEFQMPPETVRTRALEAQQWDEESYCVPPAHMLSLEQNEEYMFACAFYQDQTDYDPTQWLQLLKRSHPRDLDGQYLASWNTGADRGQMPSGATQSHPRRPWALRRHRHGQRA